MPKPAKKERPIAIVWERDFDKEIDFIKPTTSGYKILKSFIAKLLRQEKNKVLEGLEKEIKEIKEHCWSEDTHDIIDRAIEVISELKQDIE